MNEELEYAEMLEIPVSTVNVVKKQSRRKKSKNEVPEKNTFLPNETAPLKDSVIAQVNNKLNDPPFSSEPEITADAELFAESVNSEGRLDFDPVPERIDTVPLYSDDDRQSFWARHRLRSAPEEYLSEEENEEGRVALNEDTPHAVRIALRCEFVAVCALCAAIFVTNVFFPNSAVNTFFRGMNDNNVTETGKTYKDFSLAPVVSDVETNLTVSPAGILSFKDAGCVYPMADGTVSEISRSTDGTYLLKIAYSDTFTGVIGGLDYVYYAVGDVVKARVPVGYSAGENEVQLTMYEQGELLNCFYVTDENNLAWTQSE